jgi:hypothetical protein
VPGGRFLPTILGRDEGNQAMFWKLSLVDSFTLMLENPSILDDEPDLVAAIVVLDRRGIAPHELQQYLSKRLV